MVFLTLLRLGKKRTRGFLDSLRLTVHGGPGGMGHPKYGGIGGRGGSIVFVAEEDVTLSHIILKHPTKALKAKGGENSHIHRLVGEPGADFVLPVPVGVTVYTQTGVKIGDLNKPNEKLVVAKGGLGGQQATEFNGLRGEEAKIILDLKLIADVGLVGFPNAGKSSLLKAISRAKPQVADYPFTTLRPNLGVIEFPDLRKITIADLPGLIEGAHRNVGLGHSFLKHVERTKLLLFLVDINGFRLSPHYPHRSPLETLSLLIRELELYGRDILSKPALLVVNKMDTEGSDKMWENLEKSLSDFEGSIRRLPDNMRPSQAIKFDEIVPISVQNDPPAVRKLAETIRKHLDIAVEYEDYQSFLRQEDEKSLNAKRKRQLEVALSEHRPRLL